MRVFAVVCGLAAALAGQSPQFEVASIKPAAPPTPGQMQIGVQIDGAQVHWANESLQDLIASAWGLRGNQIEGPDWMSKQRFDIAAKLPAGGTHDQVDAMLQTLLIQRFELKSHDVSEATPVYALAVAAGGLKAKPVATDAAPDNSTNIAASGSRDGVSVSLGPGATFNMTSDKVDAHHLTMAQMASLLSRFLDRPVLNQTNTEGSFDFTLPLTPELYNALLIRSAINAGVELPPQALRGLQGENPGALSQELGIYGLTLNAKNAPLNHLVIDHLDRDPTADN